MGIKDFINKKPANRVELAAWVKAFFGFEIHTTVRCNHTDPDTGKPHQSQMDYIAGGFLNEYSSCVFMASRNAGKSYAAAIKAALQAHFFPGIKIAVAAFQRNQSDYIYTYLEQFLEAVKTRTGVTLAKITADEMKFANGSSVKFFSGGKSQAGIKGFHPNVLIVDECDLFSQEQFDGIANALEAGGTFTRQFDVLSTNYTVSGEGVVLKQIERLEQFNRTKNEHLLPGRIFRVCLLDILAKCDDRFTCYDDVKGHCPLWAYCKGAAKDGEGFYKVESAFETMRDSSLQVFESQMLLLRPSSQWSYFHNFSIASNVNDPDVELRAGLDTYVAFDFGGSRCPHAALVVQRDGDGCYWVIDEFLGMGLLEDLVGRVFGKYPQARDWRVFCDPKGTDTANTRGSVSYVGVLKRSGFYPRYRQLKRRQTFEQLFALISPATGKPKLKVNKRCKNLIAQIHAAEHKIKRGHPESEPADITPDDLLDCLRMAVGNTLDRRAGAPQKELGRFF